MCVVSKKTYIHPDNRREVVETYRLCHNAVGNRTCRFVEARSEEAVRVRERRPAATRQPSSPDIVTPSGLWQQLHRPVSKRNSSSRESTKTSVSSPVDSVADPNSPIQPIFQEFRPSSAQGLSLMSGGLPSARHSGTISPASPANTSNPFALAASDPEASYRWPPPLDSAEDRRRERSSARCQSSFSSANAEVDRRDSSLREYSIKRTVYEPMATSPKSRHSGTKGKGKSHARTDSHRVSYEASRQKQEDQENELQTQMERDRLAASEQRQDHRLSKVQARKDADQARIVQGQLEAVEARRRENLGKEAEEEARRRAEDLEREGHRLDAAAALEGRAQTDEDDAYDRLMNAEMSNMDQEQTSSNARKLEKVERYQERSKRSSHRSSFASPPSSPSSARHSTTLAKKPKAAVHHYPASSSSKRSSALSERGEKVIAREQGRVISASRRLTEALGGLGIEDDEEMDAIIQSQMEEQQRRLRKESESDRRRR